jgi:Ca2+-binding RTX toxin-like protein
MAIVYGTNNATNYSFNLTINQAFNYGLEDDRVVGLGGNDAIRTGAGNDHLEGGEGDNTYYDGDGNDTVLGGSGIDYVYVDAGNDIYYGEGGGDWLYFDLIHYGFKDTYKDAYQGVRVDLSLTSAQDLGAFGIDRFFGFENAAGTLGHDTIRGTNGVNSLRGSDGNDILYGRGGNDIVNGGDGADTLIGGLGSDILHTSVGAIDSSRDLVRYESLKESGVTVATRDVVYWFKPGQDKIDLSKLDANLGLKGNQAFKVVTGLTKAFGEIKPVKSGADTLVQIDGDKDNAVDMTILVKDVHLTKADFIL